MVHRKLPRSESLKDCMDRTIPYWTDTIVTDAIDAGKTASLTLDPKPKPNPTPTPSSNPNPNPSPSPNPNPNQARTC